MKFSTRTTYGLRALSVLARNYNKQTVSLSSISQKENISLGYLERIFVSLKKAKIVEAEKGVLGGYRLRKNPKEIFLDKVVIALEGEIEPFYCLSEKTQYKCKAKSKCSANKVLKKIKISILNTLKKINLSNLK